MGSKRRKIALKDQELKARTAKQIKGATGQASGKRQWGSTGIVKELN